MRPPLSPRLRQVLHLVVQGYRHEVIAQELGLGRQTVEAYVKRLKAYFHDAPELQDPRFSPITALVVVGRRYLEETGDEADNILLVDLPFETKVSLPDLLNAVADDMQAVSGRACDVALGHLHSTADQLAECWQPSQFDPFTTGMRLFLLADELSEWRLWTAALPLFSIAEHLLGRASSQAARAAIQTALMHIELGNYDHAHGELQRALHTYHAVMDPATQAHWYTTHGWLDYEQGNFAASEQSFKQCLTIAQEMDVAYLGETAQHFLGRVYGDWGRVTAQKHLADVLFHKAVVQFDKSYQLHFVDGAADNLAYDLFRKAQVLGTQRRWRQAQRLRDRARHLFGSHWGVLELDLEEAQLALMDGDIRTAQHQAEGALRMSAHISKAKEMAEALHILGTVACELGKPAQALECYVASLCIYRCRDRLRNSRVWAKIDQLADRQDNAIYHQWVRHLQTAAEERRGYFSYLDDVADDRRTYIEDIFRQLEARQV